MIQQLWTAGLSIAFALVPVLAMAHPGHGEAAGDGNSWRHYLTEPQHLLVIGGALAIAAAALWVINTLLRSRTAAEISASRGED